MLSMRLNTRYPGIEGLLQGCHLVHLTADGGVVSVICDGASGWGRQDRLHNDCNAKSAIVTLLPRSRITLMSTLSAMPPSQVISTYDFGTFRQVNPSKSL